MTAFSSLYGTRLTLELATADSTQLFTDARRKAAINRGQEEFAELTECFVRRSTVTIVSSQAEYDLASTVALGSSDFVRLAQDGVEFHYIDASSAVTYLAGPDLVRRDIDWLNQYEPDWRDSTNTSTGAEQKPSVYYLRQDGAAHYLGFWPAPILGSSASAQAVVSYLARPSPMSSATDEPFRIGSSARNDLRPYHQALVHFGASELEKLRKNTEGVMAQMQMFMSYVDRFFRRKSPKGMKALRQGRSYFKAADDRPKDVRT